MTRVEWSTCQDGICCQTMPLDFLSVNALIINVNAACMRMFDFCIIAGIAFIARTIQFRHEYPIRFATK